MPPEAAESMAQLKRHIGTFLGYLRGARQASPSTLAGYARDLEQFFSFLEKTSPEEPVTHLSVRRFLDGLRASGGSPATAARKLAAIRSYFRFLCREGLAGGNPAAVVTGPSARACRPRFLLLGEVLALLDLENPGAQGARDRALLAVMFGTGARMEDVRLLDLGDVDRVNGTVRLPGRGRQGRVVALDPVAVSALEAYLTAARAEPARGGLGPAAGAGGPCPLFPTRRGGYLSVRDVQRLLDKRVRQLAAARQTEPDELRRVLAGRLLTAGASLRAVREMFGRAGRAESSRRECARPARLAAVYRSAHPRA